jgi:predicted DCC family thiol-disulfide oxidoreductase YuxK
MQKDLILFDGVCNLCNGAVQFIIKRDRKKKFQFASLQSAIGKEKLREYGLSEEMLDSIVLVRGNGTYKVKSSAALTITKELTGLWPLMYAFIFIPKPIRDYAYNIVATNRYRLFGRRDQCMMPSSDIKDRFLK